MGGRGGGGGGGGVRTPKPSGEGGVWPGHGPGAGECHAMLTLSTR